MELIKALPEIFEDFAEQRKNSFLTMKELKDKKCSGYRSILYIFPAGDCDGYGSGYSRTLFYI